MGVWKARYHNAKSACPVKDSVDFAESAALNLKCLINCSLQTIPLMSKKQINVVLTFDFDTRAFLGVGHLGFFIWDFGILFRHHIASDTSSEVTTFFQYPFWNYEQVAFFVSFCSPWPLHTHSLFTFRTSVIV